MSGRRVAHLPLPPQAAMLARAVQNTNRIAEPYSLISYHFVGFLVMQYELDVIRVWGECVTVGV